MTSAASTSRCSNDDLNSADNDDDVKNRLLFDETTKLYGKTWLVIDAMELKEDEENEERKGGGEGGDDHIPFVLSRKKMYQNAIQEFTNILHIRESLLGNYHKDIASVYYGLGHCYYQQTKHYSNILVSSSSSTSSSSILDDTSMLLSSSSSSLLSNQRRLIDQSMAAYHTALRIWRFVNNEEENNNNEDDVPNLGVHLQQMLQSKVDKKKNYSKEQLKTYSLNINKSIRYEKAGDVLRDRGDYKSALFQYRKARAIEEDKMPFSSDYSSVGAYLGRKIALLMGINSGVEGEGEEEGNGTEREYCWYKTDRICDDKTWGKDGCHIDGLYHPKVLEYIRQGDEFYSNFQFMYAKEEYHKAFQTMEKILSKTNETLPSSHSSTTTTKIPTKGSSGTATATMVDATTSTITTATATAMHMEFQKELEKTRAETLQSITDQIHQAKEETLATVQKLLLETKLSPQKLDEESSSRHCHSKLDPTTPIAEWNMATLNNLTRTVQTMLLESHRSIHHPSIQQQEQQRQQQDIITAQWKELNTKTDRLSKSILAQNLTLGGMFFLVGIIFLWRKKLHWTSQSSGAGSMSTTSRSGPTKRRHNQYSRRVSLGGLPNKIGRPTQVSCRLGGQNKERKFPKRKVVGFDLSSSSPKIPEKKRLVGVDTSNYHVRDSNHNDSNRGSSSSRNKNANSSSYRQQIDPLVTKCQESFGTALNRVCHLVENGKFEEAGTEIENVLQTEVKFWTQLQQGLSAVSGGAATAAAVVATTATTTTSTAAATTTNGGVNDETEHLESELQCDWFMLPEGAQDNAIIAESGRQKRPVWANSRQQVLKPMSIQSTASPQQISIKSKDVDTNKVEIIDDVESFLSGLSDPSWKSALSDTIDTERFRNLASFVQQERASSDKIIYPPQESMFAALNLCPLNTVKVVILGQHDPYHGPKQATGLAFSVPKGVKLPPCLQNIVEEAMEDVLIERPTHGNLECWAKQGVLLLNPIMTVRKGQAGGHAKQGWEEFTDAIMQKINASSRGVVFLVWGRAAAKKARQVDASKHVLIHTSHPSPLHATKSNSPFLGSRCFSQANDALLAMNIPPIDWSIP